MGKLEEMIATRRLTVKSVTAAKAAADQELRSARRAAAVKRMELLLIDLEVEAPVSVEKPGYMGRESVFAEFMFEGTKIRIDRCIMHDTFHVVFKDGQYHNADSAQEVLDMIVAYFGGNLDKGDDW
jgi:hypothetical protein